jgi:hypothetical protein
VHLRCHFLLPEQRRRRYRGGTIVSLGRTASHLVAANGRAVCFACIAFLHLLRK